jgi:hypothetical protein
VRKSHLRLIREAIAGYKGMGLDLGQLHAAPSDPYYVLQPILPFWTKVEVLVLIGPRDDPQPYTALFEYGEDPPVPTLQEGW